MEKRILRLPDVMKVTGLKGSSLYSAIQRNEFPKQVSLCVRSVGWNSEEVDAWVEERITASRGAEMTAPRDLFTNSCAAAEGPGKVFDEPSPPFQLTRQFAPPRTAVVSVKKLQPHPAMIRRGLAGLNYTGGSRGPSAERRRGGSGTQNGSGSTSQDSHGGNGALPVIDLQRNRERGVPGQHPAGGPVRGMAQERPGIVAEPAN